MGETQVASTVADGGLGGFTAALSDGGIGIRVGPFNILIEAHLEPLDEPLFALYADYPTLGENSVFSLRAGLEPVRRFPRVWRKLVRFTVDGRMPHEEMPVDQALAVLEWGINLVIAMRSHCFLMLHSAVLEKHGEALLLPAAPGFGKSTLCAALAHRGWRLLSDEFGLVRPGTLKFIAVPRPIALKNESIDVIRTFAPDAYVGPSIPGTRKGTVAHLKPPADSVRRQAEPAVVRRIVFPRWQDGASLQLEPLSKAEAFMMLAMNAFNYELLGEAGYGTACDVVEASSCWRLVYSDLEEAVACLHSLADDDDPARR